MGNGPAAFVSDKSSFGTCSRPTATSRKRGVMLGIDARQECAQRVVFTV